VYYNDKKACRYINEVKYQIPIQRNILVWFGGDGARWEAWWYMIQQEVLGNIWTTVVREIQFRCERRAARAERRRDRWWYNNIEKDNIKNGRRWKIG